VSNCDQFRELIEAYALGALDAQERAAFEAHLAGGCQDCAKAVEEARWVVSQLGYLAPDAQPSELLKGRLMQTVRNEAHAAQGSQKPKGEIPFWMWVGVAALLLVTLYSVRAARRLQIDIEIAKQRATEVVQQRQELEAQLQLAKREARILTDPKSKKIMLPPKDTQMPLLEVMWHPELGLCVMGEKVPMPPNKRVFQLWLIPKTPGGKPMPMQTLWPDADGKLVRIVENTPEPMWNTKAIAITEEPEGGSLQPTGEPMWVGGVS
jgi:anti-sigma-K factor RskA